MAGNFNDNNHVDTSKFINMNNNQYGGRENNMQQPFITDFNEPQIYQQQYNFVAPPQNFNQQVNPDYPTQQQISQNINQVPQYTHNYINQPIYTNQQPVYPTQYQPVYTPPQNNIVIVNQPNQQQHIQPQQQIVTPTVIVINNDTEGYPRLETTMAMIVLILNIFLPGFGTIIMGTIGANSQGWICIGFCQFFLSVILIGWIWSILTGFTCLKYSRR